MGRLTWNRGVFSGRLSAAVTRSLKELGAKWDKRLGAFRLAMTGMPIEMRGKIAASEAKFQEKIEKLKES
jgi:hypothetical protein